MLFLQCRIVPVDVSLFRNRNISLSPRRNHTDYLLILATYLCGRGVLGFAHPEVECDRLVLSTDLPLQLFLQILNLISEKNTGVSLYSFPPRKGYWNSAKYYSTHSNLGMSSLQLTQTFLPVPPSLLFRCTLWRKRPIEPKIVSITLEIWGRAHLVVAVFPESGQARQCDQNFSSG